MDYGALSGRVESQLRNEALVEAVSVLVAFSVNDSGSILDDCLQEHFKGMMQ